MDNHRRKPWYAQPLPRVCAALRTSPEGLCDAEAAERLLPLLDEDEMYVYKRGRNAKVNSVPHKADIAQYHAATGLEALFGWLYLQGKTQRINELYAVCVEGHHGA